MRIKAGDDSAHAVADQMQAYFFWQCVNQAREAFSQLDHAGPRGVGHRGGVHARVPLQNLAHGAQDTRRGKEAMHKYDDVITFVHTLGNGRREHVVAHQDGVLRVSGHFAARDRQKTEALTQLHGGRASVSHSLRRGINAEPPSNEPCVKMPEAPLQRENADAIASAHFPQGNVHIDPCIRCYI